MQTFFSQNRNIILVALGVFIASMTGLLFLLNNGSTANLSGELKTNVIESDASVHGAEADLQYRNLFQNQEDPFLLLSLDGSIDYISADFEKVTGLGQAAMHEKTYFSLINPDDLSIVLSAFGKAMGSGDPQTMIGPYRLLDGDGKYRIYMGSFYPVKEEDKVVAVGIVNHDISGTVKESQSEAGQTAPAKTNYYQKQNRVIKNTESALNANPANSLSGRAKLVNGKIDESSGFNSNVGEQQTGQEITGSQPVNYILDTVKNTVKLQNKDSKWIMSYHPSF
jgi:PAS domain S-box-containing protein